LTADEAIAREAIRQTAERYTRAIDNRRYEELRDVFLLHGAIQVQGGARMQGVDAIVSAFAQGAAKRNAAAPGNFQRHNLTTSMIELTGPDNALATWYIMVVTELGFDHAGMYQDRLRRRGDDWLISERTARMEWVRPDSRFAAWLGAAAPASEF